MFFVEARYHRSPEKVPQQIRYISHREERFARLDGTATERVIRDAIQKTFRGAARDVQGVFAVHQHGGQNRSAHPHVHALLSPRLQNGAPTHFSPRAIERVKQRWEVEVLRALQGHERRLVVRVPRRELMPLISIQRRELSARQLALPFERWSRPRRLGLQTLAFLRSRPSRKVGKLAGPSTDAALRLLDRAMEVDRNPERAARRAALRLLSRALPAPLRDVVWLTRGIASFGVRQRW